MRTTLVLIAALLTGCLEAPEQTGSATSELTFYNPRLAVVARIAGQRRAADDLRAVGATKPPLYATWTVLQQYRSLVQFDYDSADKLDAMADALEAALATTTDVATLDSNSQINQLKLQQSMQHEAELMAMVSNLLKAMHDTTQSVIDNIKD